MGPRGMSSAVSQANSQAIGCFCSYHPFAAQRRPADDVRPSSASSEDPADKKSKAPRFLSAFFLGRAGFGGDASSLLRGRFSSPCKRTTIHIHVRRGLGLGASDESKTYIGGNSRLVWWPCELVTPSRRLPFQGSSRSLWQSRAQITRMPDSKTSVGASTGSTQACISLRNDN